MNHFKLIVLISFLIIQANIETTKCVTTIPDMNDFNQLKQEVSELTTKINFLIELHMLTQARSNSSSAVSQATQTHNASNKLSQPKTQTNAKTYLKFQTNHVQSAEIQFVQLAETITDKLDQYLSQLDIPLDFGIDFERQSEILHDQVRNLFDEFETLLSDVGLELGSTNSPTLAIGSNVNHGHFVDPSVEFHDRTHGTRMPISPDEDLFPSSAREQVTPTVILANKLEQFKKKIGHDIPATLANQSLITFLKRLIIRMSGVMEKLENINFKISVSSKATSVTGSTSKSILPIFANMSYDGLPVVNYTNFKLDPQITNDCEYLNGLTFLCNGCGRRHVRRQVCTNDSQGNAVMIMMPNVPLHGTIPEQFTKILQNSKLTHINLKNNNLTGTLDFERNAFENTEMKVLDLSSNNLTGWIDSYCLNGSKLEQFLLSNNQFFGSIYIGGLLNSAKKHLKVLDLANNQLRGTGHIGTSAFRQSALELLDLTGNGNRFDGEISMSVLNGSNLKLKNLKVDSNVKLW